jgi:hypothetical protein
MHNYKTPQYLTVQLNLTRLQAVSYSWGNTQDCWESGMGNDVYWPMDNVPHIIKRATIEKELT